MHVCLRNTRLAPITYSNKSRQDKESRTQIYDHKDHTTSYSTCTNIYTGEMQHMLHIPGADEHCIETSHVIPDGGAVAGAVVVELRPQHDAAVLGRALDERQHARRELTGRDEPRVRRSL